ncbi:MAG: sugar porter family MFS transporter [Actinomycetaceae bacterium]|nr:sugar porter family MFS transporter [Arcanobacterium sp.]MDD7686525.1 sugar porter family MFS transporter [Actinomycetaceae bacterium]MDY5272805.1 sugar porter family MFS transporter [Arcanobacterium sp.]
MPTVAVDKSRLSLVQIQARRRATLFALIATLGPFFYGFEGMVLNGAIAAVGSDFKLGPVAAGVAGAAGIIGGFIGAIFAGRISDKIGRKTTLMLVGPFLLFEAIFGAFSPVLGGYFFLIACRVIGGIGFGAATTVAPGYVAEIAPADIRGRLIGFRQLAIILGLLFAAIINFSVSHAAGGSDAVAALGLKAWQWMFLCLLIPSLAFMILTAIIPESPRYLVSVGRDAEAKEILEKVSAEQDLDASIDAIRASFGANEVVKMGIIQIMGSKWRGLVLVGAAIAAFQQLTGTNGIFFYSNMLFQAVGFSENSSFQQTLILSVFKIIGVTAGILLVDRVGRKRMLMYGGGLIFVALGIVATVFTIAPHGENGVDLTQAPVLGWFAVGALCLFLLGFTSSWGPIFSIMMGEMFPNEIRGGAMSIASGTDFLVNFIVVLLFPFLVNWSPAGVYWIFFVFGVLAVIFTGLFVKETAGKSLEEMGD